ncbi:MAG: hypothetical protein IPM56_01560 [Ignavibacteriales bacterium]|nr:MAG: hypothetical protein IPM56_01560 [Ignavibacteriales bacterium]
MSNKSFAGIFTFLLAALIIFVAGCGEQKKEEPKMEEQPKTQITEQTPAEQPKDTMMAEDPEMTVSIPDLKGTWTGKFDSRATTLKITEQDSLSFKGTITINYREVINQQVSGKLNLEKNTLTMKDLLHSRYAGSYFANLSEDLGSLSGTFTQNVDKTKFTFNLKKK